MRQPLQTAFQPREFAATVAPKVPHALRTNLLKDARREQEQNRNDNRVDKRCRKKGFQFHFVNLRIRLQCDGTLTITMYQERALLAGQPNAV